MSRLTAGWCRHAQAKTVLNCEHLILKNDGWRGFGMTHYISHVPPQLKKLMSHSIFRSMAPPQCLMWSQRQPRGPWHIDEQLYTSELWRSLCAHSRLNRWGNQSVLAHTQATAKPLSGPGSLTLTPTQVAGDTLIHLSQPRQTHLISSQLSPPSPSLPASPIQLLKHIFFSLLQFCYSYLTQFHFPYIYILIHLPAAAFLSVSWSISKPRSHLPRLDQSSPPILLTLTVGASRSDRGRRGAGQIDTHTSLHVNICSQ